MDCCQVKGLQRLFRGWPVRHEAKTFARHGPNYRQAAFLEALEGEAEGASVLDVGGGVGALSLSLLALGAADAQLIEISPDYLDAARALAAERGIADRLQLLEGDFVTREGVAPAEIVTLDRVVCCYPDAERMLTKAARCSRRWLLITYPRVSWLARVYRAGVNGGMRLLGWPYRFYLHDEARLLAAAQSVGHRLVAQQKLSVWQLVVLAR